jgi:NTE family protein
MDRAILAFLRAAGQLWRVTLRHAAALALVGVTACGNPAEEAFTANPPVADPSAIPAAPALALVLSSGGPRGFAHIGVLKVLEEAGVRPDVIVGSSSGALVGVLYAAKPSARDIEAQALTLGGTDVFDYDVFRRRVSGTALQAWVNGALANRPLDRLDLPVVVVATRQRMNCRRVHRGDAGRRCARQRRARKLCPVDISAITIDGDRRAATHAIVRRSAHHVIAVDAQNAHARRRFGRASDH